MKDKKIIEITNKNDYQINPPNSQRLIIKDLNENKQIGLLLISLINDTSKQIIDYESTIKEKNKFQLEKKLSSPIESGSNIKFDYVKENSKRLIILDNFDKIENIFDDNFLIPNKVLESVLVLVLKMLSKIINTLDVKRLIICISSIIKKQILIFSSINKLNDLYEILISKKIIENIIMNYLMILDNCNLNSYLIENQNKEFENSDKDTNDKINEIDKDLVDEIFSSLNFLYFPMKISFKLSIMPGLISKLAKFFLKNNNICKSIKFNNAQNANKHLLSKKVIFIIQKLFNNNLALLTGLPSNENFLGNFPNFFEAFTLFFNDLYRIIIDENQKDFLFSIMDFEIKLKNVMLNDRGSTIMFESEKERGLEYYDFTYNKTILDEINYSGYLISDLFKKLKQINSLEKMNKISKINFDDYFLKINYINQKYIFELCSKINQKIQANVFRDNQRIIHLNNYYNNFQNLLDYETVLDYLNLDLKSLNEILNKHEYHKLNPILYKVNGLVYLYKLKLKKDQFEKERTEKIKNDIINIAWKFIDCLHEKFFIIRNLKFLEYQNFSHYDFKIKNLSKEVCLENIFDIFIQFFNLHDNQKKTNNFISSYSFKNSDDFNTFVDALNFINLIYADPASIGDSNELNNYQDLKLLDINLLFKSILTKNLSIIKNLKKFATKINNLNEEIEFIKVNILENTKNNVDDESCSNQENYEITQVNSYENIVEYQSKIKAKYLIAISSLKNNFKALLKNLVIILLVLNKNLDKIIIEGNLYKNFLKQINYIYSNFLNFSESENDVLNVLYILNENEDTLISNIFNKNKESELVNFKRKDCFSKNSHQKNLNKIERFNSSIHQNELLRSVVMFSYYIVSDYQIKIGNTKDFSLFSQLELKQILMFTLSNYANNNSKLLKFSSIILIKNLNTLNDIQKKPIINESSENKELNNNNSENFKNFVLSNFDFLLNSIMKKLIYQSRIEDNSNQSKELAKIKKIEISNLFYSLILLIMEIEDNDIRNFYSLELNKFMNKFFTYIDEEIKNKDLINIECSLEIINRITEYQDLTIKGNYIEFLNENNKIYENSDFNLEEILKEQEKSVNVFSEFLRNNSNFYNANIHRKLILRLCPLFLSNNNVLINKFLNIFSNILLILFMLPLDKEENTNFSAEDPANVLIKNSLGPLLYETWNYFLYVIKNLKNIKSLNQVLSFLSRLVKIYPNFFNESRIFKELIPAFAHCLEDCLFKNYEVSVISNSIFSFLFNLNLLFYFNMKNTLYEEKYFYLVSLEKNSTVKILEEAKFYIQAEHLEILRELLFKIKKFFGNKLDNYNIKNLNSFIDLNERMKKFKSLTDNNNNDLNSNITNDYYFFNYVERKSKNKFNCGNKNYEIQHISLYINLETELIKAISEKANFDFNMYLNYLENLFKTN